MPHQIARPLRYPAAQDLVPVLCNPNHVILDIEHRVRAMPVLDHPPIVVGMAPLEADRLKGGEIRPGAPS
jgi:hypothetical protein